MVEAKFINSDTKHLCNICSDQIETDKVIALKCDPKKHIFCYDCIFEWYYQLNKKKNTSNYPTVNICPICRKKGGLLPVYGNKKPIKNINIMNNQNQNILINICGAKLKTKNGAVCNKIGKTEYSGLCGIHKNVFNSVCHEININPNKLMNECGIKLKTKEGFCHLKGNFNGLCGKHKI
jgi:hypothetical protein